MENVLVSIIIRTCQRPFFLREALKSVQCQSVDDYEVVVIEDGQSSAKGIIEEFPDLKMTYYCTNEPVGRSRAGNIGMELSVGRFLNFLDDDDLLLPNHLETMLEGFSVHQDAAAIHTSSLERMIRYVSYDPLRYVIEDEIEKYNEPVDPKKIMFQNMFPIQAVMFKRELFEKFGGMDEQLEWLEDWDLWIKYSMNGKFYFINKITSVYHITSDRKKRLSRQEQLTSYEQYIHQKYKEIMEQIDYRRPGILKRMYHYFNKHGTLKTTKKIYRSISDIFYR